MRTKAVGEFWSGFEETQVGFMFYVVYLIEVSISVLVVFWLNVGYAQTYPFLKLTFIFRFYPSPHIFVL